MSLLWSDRPFAAGQGEGRGVSSAPTDGAHGAGRAWPAAGTHRADPERCSVVCPRVPPPTWLFTIRIAAPAVISLITECGTLPTHLLTRTRPGSSCKAPTMKVSVSTGPWYYKLSTTARGATSAIVVREMAFVRPVNIHRLLPNSTANTKGTMAAYRPWAGGDACWVPGLGDEAAVRAVSIDRLVTDAATLRHDALERLHSVEAV